MPVFDFLKLISVITAAISDNTFTPALEGQCAQLFDGWSTLRLLAMESNECVGLRELQCTLKHERLFFAKGNNDI